LQAASSFLARQEPLALLFLVAAVIAALLARLAVFAFLLLLTIFAFLLLLSAALVLVAISLRVWTIFTGVVGHGPSP
jgi:hypothetical protein